MGEINLKTIEIELSEKSIKKAMRQVKQFEKDIANAMSELARYITEELGVEIAKMFLAEFHAVDSGALFDSIYGKFDPSSNEGFISAGEGLEDGYEESGSYAVYVEYGTGWVGENHPHPDPNGYEYDVHDHGTGGWWYRSENGWYTPEDGNGVTLAWTRGMPAMPFMYNTMKALEEDVEKHGGQIIAEYIP